MSALEIALAEALLFLLARAAKNDPEHRYSYRESRDCECDACRHRDRIQKEMR